MRYKLVLWDFDGTLADTLAGLLGIYNDLAGTHGFQPVDDPQTIRNLSLLPFLRSHKIPLHKLPALVRDVLAAQKREMQSIRLFPDLPRVLSAIQRASYRMAILSSNARENILACLQANGVEGLFETVIGYRRLLGKGRAIRRFAKEQGLAGADVLYVGDEVRDIEAARAASVDIAAVTWGFNTQEILAGYKPNYLIERADEFLKVLGLKGLEGPR